MKQLTYLGITFALLLAFSTGPALAQNAIPADAAVTPPAVSSEPALSPPATAQPLSWSVTGTFDEAVQEQVPASNGSYYGYCYNNCAPCNSHLDCPARGGFYYECTVYPAC